MTPTTPDGPAAPPDAHSDALVFTTVYRSVATTPMGAAELAHLLRRCRAHNATIGVTGILLYRDGRFMQLLEGAEDTVTSLMNTINADPRHEDVLTLWSDYTDKRSFPDWSMAFSTLAGLSPDALPGYTDFMDRPVDALELTRTPTVGQELLGLFRRAT